MCDKASAAPPTPFHHEAEYEACLLQSHVARKDLLRIFDMLPEDDSKDL